jgi:hypothetical protein
MGLGFNGKGERERVKRFEVLHRRDPRLQGLDESAQLTVFCTVAPASGFGVCGEASNTSCRALTIHTNDTSKTRCTPI